MFFAFVLEHTYFWFIFRVCLCVCVCILLMYLYLSICALEIIMFTLLDGCHNFDMNTLGVGYDRCNPFGETKNV